MITVDTVHLTPQPLFREAFFHSAKDWLGCSHPSTLGPLFQCRFRFRFQTKVSFSRDAARVSALLRTPVWVGQPIPFPLRGRGLPIVGNPPADFSWTLPQNVEGWLQLPPSRNRFFQISANGSLEMDFPYVFIHISLYIYVHIYIYRYIH